MHARQTDTQTGTPPFGRQTPTQTKPTDNRPTRSTLVLARVVVLGETGTRASARFLSESPSPKKTLYSDTHADVVQIVMQMSCRK